LLVTEGTTITAKPWATHHLLRELEHVCGQFRVEVGRLSGRDGKVPGMNENVTRPQLQECGAGDFSDGQLIGAGESLRFGEGGLRRSGGGAVSGAEVVGEWNGSATGSLDHSL